MINSKLVSVVVNCFNGQDYLKEALQSVLDQDYENWELIFWDNCSTDQSKKIFDGFLDSRFKYYYANEHTVLYEARNLALDKCRGDLIAFLDVDDYWKSNKLSMQVREFNDDIGLVCSDYLLLNERKNTIKHIKSPRINARIGMKSIVSDYSICMSSIVINKFAINNKNLKFDSRYQIIGDFKMVVDILNSYKISCVNEALVTYRWHGENISIREKEKHLIELKKLEHECQNEEYLTYLEEKIAYLEATDLIMGEKKYHSIVKMKKIQSTWKKSKIIFGILMPLWIIKKLRV